MFEPLNTSDPHQQVHTLHKLIFCTLQSCAWMHWRDLPVHIYHKHTYITSFLAICRCLDLSHALPLSCSMHLSSSLCCMWFVRADDESVYEWRGLISPEWSLSLPLSLLLSPLLSLQYLSIQSKRIPLCPCYPLQHCSFLRGASACLMSQFNIIQLWAEGVTDL